MEEQLARLEAAAARWHEKYAEGILRLNLEWFKEAEKTLRAQS